DSLFEIPSALRRVFTSGEALDAGTAARWRELGGAPLHNLYGPTEAAVDVTFHKVTAADSVTVPIGRPVFNTRVYVLDSGLRPVPVGVTGELYLAGEQLARGYVSRPELTAERFVANPFGTGGRMYRTGDLVRWNRAGELEYLGRNDFQVKLRGLRIELGDIEAALSAQHDLSRAAVVVAGSGDRARLHAYVVPATGAAVDPGDVLSAASRALPLYMVPAGLTILDELPLTTSGKLDRAALPQVDTGDRHGYRAPAEGSEAVVAAVMAELLGLDQLGADDDFFAAGGNSLLAMRVVTRVNELLGCEVNVAEIFGAPTPARLAEATDTAADRTAAPVTRMSRPARIPLSLAQSRIWLLNRIDPESARYNIPFALRLHGPLDEIALSEAVADVLVRHESLRTLFPEDDQGPRQQILSVGECAATALVLRTVDAPALEAELAAAAARGFDLRTEIPLRITVLRHGPDDHVLLVLAHHIAADGLSTMPLARDLVTAYAARRDGAAPGWQPLPVQYADFTLWQHALLGDAGDPDSRLHTQLEFWRRELAGLPPVVDLPTDRPRPAIASGAGATVEFTVPPELTAAIEALARSAGVSTFMVLHAAYATAVAKLSGTDDLAIGTPIAGRSARALDEVVGMFVNTLALRTRVHAGDRFTDLLAQVRARDVRAFTHADLPFDRLVEQLDLEHSRSYAPLVQVLLSFQQHTGPDLRLPGLDIAEYPLTNPVAAFDLALTLTEVTGAAGRELRAELRYATDLFDRATMHSLAGRLTRVLSAVVAEPDIRIGAIDLLEPSERLRVLEHWNATDAEIAGPATLAELFEARVSRTPDAPALTFGGTTLTYAAFAGRVNRLARHLISLGVRTGSLVAVAAPRSLELLTGIYAAVTAGAGYVPIDPDHPAERIDYVLETAKPVCVLGAAEAPI
ncbi:condensation domain-containing protein, partial [Nocardia vermiculata]